jgi:sulfoxide reductase heme-binding subunit YedZ
MSRVSVGKSVLWTVLALPAAVALYRYATEPGIWPGDLLHPTGEWSARFIIIALMLTPLAQLLPESEVVKWLVRHRRAFGVAGFAYAVLHLVFYVLDMETVAAMLAELGATAIWTGWLALMCLVPPAAASSDSAMRLLRRNWKRVQRLVCPAAVLTLVHWLLVHDGKVAAILHFAPLILLQALRLARQFQRTPTERKIA